MRGWKAGVNTVDAVVEALCLDFPRRADAIAKKNVTHRTEMEYRYLNYKILTAVKEIVREDWAETMIEDKITPKALPRLSTRPVTGPPPTVEATAAVNLYAK